MKYALKPTAFSIGHSDTLDLETGYLLSSSGAQKNKMSTTLQAQFEPQKKEPISSLQAPRHVFSRSMEKSFQRLKKSQRTRKAFVKAELTNGISSQIRTLRKDRGWSQAELAKKLMTTQAVVSRLEDPSYGKFSIKTLLDISAVFDVALLAKFVPFRKLIAETFDTSASNLNVPTFEHEIQQQPPADEQHILITKEKYVTTEYVTRTTAKIPVGIFINSGGVGKSHTYLPELTFSI